MDYDTYRLAALGKTRRALRQKLDDNRAEITPEVLAALRAGIPQARVVELSGMTREWLRRLAAEHGVE
jgi:hypothetical protein